MRQNISLYVTDRIHIPRTFLLFAVLNLSPWMLVCRSDHGSGHGGSQGLAHLPHTRHPRGYALQMPPVWEFIVSFECRSLSLHT